MTIGVLGASGFVGTNLMAVLKERDVKCVGGNRANGVDARDVDSTARWITHHRIKKVVNLAAVCGGIGLNKASPADLWRANTDISTGALEAARKAGVEKYVAVGTVCSYGKHTLIPFKEEYLSNYGLPEETNLAYGMAKFNGLIGAQAYAKQYDMNVCCLVPVNMYGPYDNFDLETSHVIPAIIRKMLAAKNANEPSVTLWGTGTPTREFLYAGDFAAVIIEALDKLNTPEFINVGTGTEISIGNIAAMIADAVGYNGTIVWDSTKPDGQPRRCLDISRMRRLLGDMQQTDLLTGLSATIKWYTRGL